MEGLGELERVPETDLSPVHVMSISICCTISQTLHFGFFFFFCCTFFFFGGKERAVRASLLVAQSWPHTRQVLDLIYSLQPSSIVIRTLIFV